MTTKLENVTRIFQTLKYEEVNDKLSQGYKILKIFSTKIPTSNSEELVQPCYVLGTEAKQ